MYSKKEIIRLLVDKGFLTQQRSEEVLGIQEREGGRLSSILIEREFIQEKEIIDFRQVYGESQSAWEAFLQDLYRRGLEGQSLKLIIIDGGKGLLAALPLVYGDVPIQRCWAHKTRNVLNYVKRADQKKVKRDLHRISHARIFERHRKPLSDSRFGGKLLIRRPCSVCTRISRSC
jgi:hypothetical protein